MVRCVVYHNDEPIKTYELNEEIITIGRLPENTISIANMGISRRHARIERMTDGTYAVTDLNSLNGTYVNNTKAKKTTINDGDHITMGKFVVRFQVFETEEYTPPSSDPVPEANGESKHAEISAANATATADIPDTRKTPKRDIESQRSATGGAVLIETSMHVVYKIDKPMLTIGASEEDDIFVNGFLIGEGHAVIEKKDGGVWIGAQRVMGRFRVNGKKVNYHRLEHKDRIEIGNSTFRFMENG
ncbi:MAG: FHA domain-containing protein [Chitinivibrionales bacterium]|nr:FHA domain-containing protein [Chitinivibrionales bacterium]MBD3358100.1 FHA domain-containing protein [Chitinivibrionales bacterium]